MKVLFVTNLYPTENNPDYGVFTKDQIEAVIATGNSGKIIFINARERGIIEYWRAIITISKIYKEYDLIHCFHGLTLICAFISTRNIPILISFLNEIKYESFKKNKLINSTLVKIYKYILRSNRIYKIFKDKIPTEPILRKQSFYLPNGVNLTAFFPIDKELAVERLKLDKNKTYILFVSSKDVNRNQKRFDIFTKVIAILNQKYSFYNFHELIMSNVPRELAIYYYNAATLHLLTSDYEGSPNSIKESMACNTPIVSTDVGNVRQMISGASNCIISDQNPLVLAENVIKSINSPNSDLREILIKNQLTKDAKTEELVNIYYKIYEETKFEKRL